jgi:hypothetical protein
MSRPTQRAPDWWESARFQAFFVTPVQPLRLAGRGGYSMFDDLQRAYPWVLPIIQYRNNRALIESLETVIAPAEEMAKSFRRSQ